MNNLQMHIQTYLEYCKTQKRLDAKTLKSYRIDLQQFFDQPYIKEVDCISPDIMEHYIATLRNQFQPKAIPLNTLELLLTTIYEQCKNANTLYRQRNALRDAAVAELLFSSGMRISELCALRPDNVNLYDGTILIYGKGSKERRMINKYCSLAAIEMHITPHIVRHIFATSLLEADVDSRPRKRFIIVKVLAIERLLFTGGFSACP